MKFDGVWYSESIKKNSYFKKYISIKNEQYKISNFEILNCITANDIPSNNPHFFSHKGTITYKENKIIFHQKLSTNDISLNDWDDDVIDREYEYILKENSLILIKYDRLIKNKVYYKVTYRRKKQLNKFNEKI
jgi:hypothetical protein